jgi:hypothetical protein
VRITFYDPSASLQLIFKFANPPRADAAAAWAEAWTAEYLWGMD